MPNSSMTCHALCKHEDMSEEIEAVVQIRRCFYVFPDPGLKDYDNQTILSSLPSPGRQRCQMPRYTQQPSFDLTDT